MILKEFGFSINFLGVSGLDLKITISEVQKSFSKFDIDKNGIISINGKKLIGLGVINWNRINLMDE